MQNENDDDDPVLSWDTLIASWKHFQRKYTGPDTLDEYARMVVQYPEPFRKVTRSRAQFYLDITNNKIKTPNFSLKQY